jgi:ribosomal protein L23
MSVAWDKWLGVCTYRAEKAIEFRMGFEVYTLQVTSGANSVLVKKAFEQVKVGDKCLLLISPNRLVIHEITLLKKGKGTVIYVEEKISKVPN